MTRVSCPRLHRATGRSGGTALTSSFNDMVYFATVVIIMTMMVMTANVSTTETSVQAFAPVTTSFSSLSSSSSSSALPSRLLTAYARTSPSRRQDPTKHQREALRPSSFSSMTQLKPVSGSTAVLLSSLSLSSPSALEAVADNYGEESRTYRRTIYTHDDWKKHRNPTRFFSRAMTIFRSGIYRNIRLPVSFVTTVSMFVVIWNALVVAARTMDPVGLAGTAATVTTTTGGSQLSWLIHLLSWSFLPKLTLPLQPFTLSSASLGLLLVFRTNTGYSRWDEARKNWGMNINRTRDLLRMAVSWYDESYDGRNENPSSTKLAKKRDEDLTALALATWAFVRSMKRHLSPSDDEADFEKELSERLPKVQAETILTADHRPNRALFDLSVAIENLPMHFLRKNQMHLALTKFEDNLGSSERLLSSPVPLFYSRHLQRFLLFWMTGLPFALYEVFSGSWHHFMLIPATVLISTFMFGIDELANQMEEPFTILPQQAFCDRIYKWCMEIITWKPGDNGTKLNKTKDSVGGGADTTLNDVPSTVVDMGLDF